MTASQLTVWALEPRCHRQLKGLALLGKEGVGISEMMQSEWRSWWKNGEVKGHKQWWPCTAARHSVDGTGFMSVM